MNKTTRALLTGIVATALTAIGLAAPAPASEAEATVWYLAIGDSVSKGLQPGLGIDPDGGFTGQVLDHLQASDDKYKQRNLACHITETSAEMIHGGDCAYEEGSQLAQALVFLRAHADTTGVVTLTIGGNDISPCLGAGDLTAIQVCIGQRLQQLATNLSRMLHDVHQAAPNATVVVGNYYNPYVIHPTMGALTVQAASALNSVIAQVAGAYGDSVADVAHEFHSAPEYSVAEAQGWICLHTYMCAIGNIHPRDSGYDLLAAAFIAKL